MPILIPTRLQQEIDKLKTKEAPKILAKFEASLKDCEKKIPKNTAESQLISLLYEYLNALKTPYPPNLLSAALAYFSDKEQHVATSTANIEKIKNQLLPLCATQVDALEKTTINEYIIFNAFTYLTALYMHETERQKLIDNKKSSFVDKKAHAALNEQSKNFQLVANDVVKPLLDIFTKKIDALQAVKNSATTAGMFADPKNNHTNSHHREENKITPTSHQPARTV